SRRSWRSRCSPARSRRTCRCRCPVRASGRPSDAFPSPRDDAGRVNVVYSPRYEIALPGHIWPTSKYRLIAEALRSDGPGASAAGPPFTFAEPVPASWDDLALVHTADYLRKLRESTMTAEDIATLELPWVPALADAFRLMAGGTIDAVGAALDAGAAAHLGGGLHHAFANHGEGFCPLNDVAVAIRVLQRPSTRVPRSRQAPIRRAAIV